MAKYLFAVLAVAIFSGCMSMPKIPFINDDEPKHVLKTAPAFQKYVVDQEEQNRKWLLGRWYGENITASGYDRQYIIERFTDGTMKTHFRFIDPRGHASEQVEEATWGISGGVYYSTTTGVVQGDQVLPTNKELLSTYNAYNIIDLSRTNFRYQHVKSGNTYEVHCVRESFTFPR
jgi:hypothetical protein